MGLDIRSNWLHHDRHLLRACEISADELRSILTLGSLAIISTMEALYEKTVASNPPGARIHHPWLFTIKLADYSSPHDALTEDAMQIVHTANANTNENYGFDQLNPRVHPYLDAVVDAGFLPRIPGRMKGWDNDHDGIWLQIQHPSHRDSSSEVHVWEGEHWHITAEEQPTDQ